MSCNTTIQACGGGITVVLPPDRRVVVPQQNNQTAQLGIPGPQGPPGPPGPAGGTTIELVAGIQLHSLRMGAATDGRVFHPDVLDEEHAGMVCGLVLTASAPNAGVFVQLAGEVTEASWGWTPGLIYCGQAGVLTQSPEVYGWLLAVGRALSPTSISIDIDTAIMRV